MTKNMNGVKPVALIQVALMPDGRIDCVAQVPNRQCFLMMMETAKFDMQAKMKADESGPKVEQSPPGFIVDRAG